MTAFPSVDATAAHAEIVAPAVLVHERRLLYGFATELVAPELITRPLPDELLDNTYFRYRVGESLAGQSTISSADLEFAATFRESCMEPSPRICLSVAPNHNDWLAKALVSVQPELDGAGLRLMTDAEPDRLTAVIETIRAGLALVRAVHQELADDLLEHVTLLAIIEPGTSIVSASSRYFPGLVLIEQPVHALDVAEAIVHEGAHQKFFDLAITHSFLDIESDAAECFVPPWSGAQWPMEQTVAAWHAYSCLAEFARFVPDGEPASDHSLLPKAAERSAEIGRWLLAKENHLGTDARRLLRLLSRTPVSPAAIPATGSAAIASGDFVWDPLARICRSGLTGRVLTGRNSTVPELYWLDGDTADIAERLHAHSGTVPFDRLAQEMTAQWQVDSTTARARTAQALDELVQFDLVIGE